ncbi:uncharacterized protein JCM10292_007250 [Rhodotorula paludigena]|uniref:uncharacterized protein n=1 Tax=Rhodotorula paludigena TaxID=86838 RepID=UPI00317C2B87
METYASLSLNSVSYFTPANKGFFVETCNPAGFTDVDQYCAVGTAELCCGLCPNTSVNGPGQFVWAIISYGCTAFSYTLAPDDVWGLAVMQAFLANAFITVGLICVGLDAAKTGMTRYHTQFLWPQALAFIAILAPAIFAPQWSRLNENQKGMEALVFQHTQALPTEALRHEVKAVEAALYNKNKRKHDGWGVVTGAVWVLNMAYWTGAYAWVCSGSAVYSQPNCEDVITYVLSPTIVTIILGALAWLLVILKVFLLARKEKQGASDYIIDRFFPRKKDGKERNMKEHRRLERKITISVTVFMYLIWFALNTWLYVEGVNNFLLSGADFFTYGQLDQITALFVDLLGLWVAVSSYFRSRDELRREREDWQKRSRGATAAGPLQESTEDRGVRGHLRNISAALSHRSGAPNVDSRSRRNTLDVPPLSLQLTRSDPPNPDDLRLRLERVRSHEPHGVPNASTFIDRGNSPLSRRSTNSSGSYRGSSEHEGREKPPERLRQHAESSTPSDASPPHAHSPSARATAREPTVHGRHAEDSLAKRSRSKRRMASRSRRDEERYFGTSSAASSEAEAGRY